VADIITMWPWRNYRNDTSDGSEFHYEFNSDQERFFDLSRRGDNLWLISSRRIADATLYCLLACLVVIDKSRNASDDPFIGYGVYKVRGDSQKSRYFDPNQTDITDLLFQLRFNPFKPFRFPRSEKQKMGSALQTVGELTKEDSQKLQDLASQLAVINPARD